MMHACKESCNSSHGRAHRLQEDAIHNVCFFALPMYGSTEMDCHGLARIFRNVGLKDRLKDDAHWIGKARRRVGHLRQEPWNPTRPERASYYGAPASKAHNKEPQQREQNR